MSRFSERPAAALSRNGRRLNFQHVSGHSGSVLTLHLDLGSACNFDRALDCGERAADAMARRGLIIGAFLCLDGEVRTVGSKQIALGVSYENHLQPPITPDYAHA